MHIDHHILTILLCTPLIGAALCASLPGPRQDPTHHRPSSPPSSPSPSLCTCPTYYAAATAEGTFRFTEKPPLDHIPPPSATTSASMASACGLVVLTGFLAPLGVLASWNKIDHRRKTFYSLFLLQQVAMLGIFVALDLFLYYGFWELSLVPMTILIAVFGRTKNKRTAAIK